MIQMEKPDPVRIKEISEDILKSMLERSYPVVNAAHYFEKYSVNGKPDQQFAHAMQMMEKGGILRMDTKDKPFSVTFVLMENGKPKMHHMIDDEWKSKTFGQLFNDPYEGDKKRQTCYTHLKEGYTQGCEKCENEINSMICKNHNNILSKCEKCIALSKSIKEGLTEKDSPELVTEILRLHKIENWSYGN